MSVAKKNLEKNFFQGIIIQIQPSKIRKSGWVKVSKNKSIISIFFNGRFFLTIFLEQKHSHSTFYFFLVNFRSRKKVENFA